MQSSLLTSRAVDWRFAAVIVFAFLVGCLLYWTSPVGAKYACFHVVSCDVMDEMLCRSGALSNRKLGSLRRLLDRMDAMGRHDCKELAVL